MSHVTSECHSHYQAVALKLIEEGQSSISHLIVRRYDLDSGQPVGLFADQPVIDAVYKGWAIDHDFAAMAVAWRVSFAPKRLTSYDCRDCISLKNFGKAGNSHAGRECKSEERRSALESLAGRQ